MWEKIRKILCFLLFITLLCGDGVFFQAYSSTINPNIYDRFPDKNDLLPYGTFDIYYQIDDTHSGIDTSSDTIILQKWDGVSVWWSDISGTYISWSTITTTWATYSVIWLPYGKYRNTFSIDDNNINNTTVSTIFYIDEPELIISTGSIDIGSLSLNTQKISTDELMLTVKTVGAGFSLDMIKDNLLELDADDAINDWDGSTGFWYDSDPYTSTISIINSVENIASQTGSINTNGDKNTYQYKIKYWALISDGELSGWDYTASLDFRINLTYQDVDDRCKLNGVSSFPCDI